VAEDDPMRSHGQCEPRTAPEDEPRQSAAGHQQPGRDDRPPPTAVNGAKAEEAPQDPSQSNASGHSGSGVGETNQKPPQAGRVNGACPQPNGAAAAEKTNSSPLLRASMRAAIDALADAEQYAAERNFPLRFTNEDVRATGITIFIAVTRERSTQ
jgi:hypothetical protein